MFICIYVIFKKLSDKSFFIHQKNKKIPINLLSRWGSLEDNPFPPLLSQLFSEISRTCTKKILSLIHFFNLPFLFLFHQNTTTFFVCGTWACGILSSTGCEGSCTSLFDVLFFMLYFNRLFNSFSIFGSWLQFFPEWELKSNSIASLLVV